MFFVYMYFLNCIPPCVIIDIIVDDKTYVFAFKLNDLITLYVLSSLLILSKKKQIFI